MSHEKILEEKIVLQAQEVRKGVIQFKVTIPVKWVVMHEWKKGTVLTAKRVLGSNKITIEEEE